MDLFFCTCEVIVVPPVSGGFGFINFSLFQVGVPFQMESSPLDSDIFYPGLGFSLNLCALTLVLLVGSPCLGSVAGVAFAGSSWSVGSLIGISQWLLLSCPPLSWTAFVHADCI